MYQNTHALETLIRMLNIGGGMMGVIENFQMGNGYSKARMDITTMLFHILRAIQCLWFMKVMLKNLMIRHIDMEDVILRTLCRAPFSITSSVH